MKMRPLLTAGLLLVPFAAPMALAQGGSLTPPGAPAPTMRSLQEIWNKITALETQNTALQSQIASQQTQISLLQKSGSILHYAAGGTLPWVLTTVDNSASVGQYSSLAFGPDGQPAIAYYDATTFDPKIARYDGTVWNYGTVVKTSGVSDGISTSLAFGPDGQPAIAYGDLTNGDLIFARFNGTAWTTTTVDASTTGGTLSLAFGPDGQPAIVYAGGFLKIARYNGTVWGLSIVDSTAGSSFQSASLAFGPDGQPAISYQQNISASGVENLKFAIFDGNSWILSNVRNDAELSSATSLAFGPDGQPAVCFIDSSQLVLARLTTGTPSYWAAGTVDSLNSSNCSLAFGPDGQPAVSYTNVTDGDLKFARYNGAAWSLTTVDAGTVVTGKTSLAFGSDGQPAIAYYDSNDTALKFARMGAFTSAQ